LREVAEATKINMRYLEAMERNDFAYLPGGLFNRGFVRAYCQYIGVDSEAMVNAYLLEIKTQDGSAGTRAPGLLRGRADRAHADPGAVVTGSAKRASTGRRIVLAGIVALVLAAAGTVLALWLMGKLPGVSGATTTGRGEAGARATSTGKAA